MDNYRRMFNKSFNDLSFIQNITNTSDKFVFVFDFDLTLTSKSHRPAYGTDGDYFSKPSVDDIIETAYSIMNEYDPNNYPELI